jgi:CDP-glycerol glycerophosphotransferase
VAPILSGTVSLCWAFWPRSDRPVIYAGPALDLNGLAVLRRLPELTTARPVLLTHEPDVARSRLATYGYDTAGVDLVQPNSLRGLRYVLATRLFLFTEFLYRGPRPRGRRLVVNLWHGDGPKVTVPEQHRRVVPASHVVVSGTRRFGELKAEAFSLPRESLWLTGNPRIDEMRYPTDDAALEALGLDPAVPIVLWAPTFRQASHAEVRDWADSADVRPFDAVLSSGIFAQLLAEGLVQVVVKPHPFDPTDFSADGLTSISDRQLEAAGTDLYRFLGRCQALITDYSSIWTDFLAVDRPIVLFCPDFEQYSAGRGLDRSLTEFPPGPVLRDADELVPVLRRIGAGEDVGAEERAEACSFVGATVEFGATDRLMQGIAAELARRSWTMLPAAR